MTTETPQLTIGILTAESFEIELSPGYTSTPAADISVPLRFSASPSGKVVCNSDSEAKEYRFDPENSEATFTVRDVKIGIGFHWEQLRDQRFGGSLRVIADGEGRIVAINVIDIESYLRSVISSEMNPKAPEEFLKAHAVISRSWALAQITDMPHTRASRPSVTDSEIRRWYDREAHTLFNLCADDHCQRYQGIPAEAYGNAARAAEATRGEVLTFGGRLCDARFSKCCGGMTELFSTCWQDTDLPYLQAVPDPYCESPSPSLMSRVLNDYDRSTPHLYRWEICYTAGELERIVRERTGIDFGPITALTPLHRGPSERIDRLEIRGLRRTMIIGKELEIRKALSESHLYSSAFTAEGLEADSRGVPSRWILKGSGWGHGVGLCQIGAAVMADRGFSYRDILAHYFPGAEITTIY